MDGAPAPRGCRQPPGEEAGLGTRRPRPSGWTRWGARESRGHQETACGSHNPYLQASQRPGLSLAPRSGPQSHTDAPGRPTVLQTKPARPPRAPSRLSAHHGSHSCARTSPAPHNEDGQTDAWMDRVTGCQHLQKADSQAPRPGIPPGQRLPVVEALEGRPAACKPPRGRPLPGSAGRGRAGPPRSSTARGQGYSHLPHTEPSYPKQDGKEQKQRVSESTAQAGTGPPGPGRRGRTRPCPREGGPDPRVRVSGGGGGRTAGPESTGTPHPGCRGPAQRRCPSAAQTGDGVAPLH